MTTTTANGTVRPIKVAPMPEFLTRKDHQGTAWTIEEGQPVRGDAWTNTVESRMRVPMGADEVSRIVRAHEMAHAKFSPLTMHSDGRYGATTESIIVAEEYRVNTLIAKAGFDIDNLADGSETKSGEIVGENNDWNGAIRFATAVAGTKASASFLRGVGKTNPKMAESLREFNKALKKRMKRAAAHRKFGSTEPTTQKLADGTTFTYPVGFNASIKLAEFIDSFLIQDGTEDGDTELPQDIPDPEEIKEADKGGARGKFARVVLKNVPKPETVSGRLGRKRIASDIGKNPRRMERMLTDPDRRVFDRWSRASGGVVVIDQSGSMRLTNDDIWAMIKSAPGCVIIGYSHAPGSTNEPNTWVLAERGKVVKNLNGVPGGRGNGVDGPALRFAQTKRKKGEPLIWVCDGIVTDGATDSQFANLDYECVKLVRQHRIHMVPNVDEAVKALKRASDGAQLPARLVGALKRYANV
jgi:hypothetical protein